MPTKNLTKLCHEQRFDEISAMYNLMLDNSNLNQTAASATACAPPPPPVQPTPPANSPQKNQETRTPELNARALDIVSKKN